MAVWKNIYQALGNIQPQKGQKCDNNYNKKNDTYKAVHPSMAEVINLCPPACYLSVFIDAVSGFQSSKLLSECWNNTSHLTLLTGLWDLSLTVFATSKNCCIEILSWESTSAEHEFYLLFFML